MNSKIEIIKMRFEKLDKHYQALRAYKQLIDTLIEQKDIFSPDQFNALKVEERAILDAYLKRFSSMQDFLVSKLFPIILELAGISNSKMSEVLYHIEKEEIIDSFDHWIELREIRNALEHDYPENLQEALLNLKFCIDNFATLESYYLNAIDFARKYSHENF